LEPLASSPYLEVQERAVEFLELFRLAKEAIIQQPVPDYTTNTQQDTTFEPPLILTQAIPSLFRGFELNPVAPKAQKKVPLPPTLDLDTPINSNISLLLSSADFDTTTSGKADEEFERFYYQKPVPVQEAASNRIDRAASGSSVGGGSYQSGEGAYLDPETLARRKAERKDKNKDDPFYIGGGSDTNSGRNTPNPLGNETIDIDSIPIMKLDLGGDGLELSKGSIKTSQKRERKKVEIVGDEKGEDLVGSDKSDRESPTISKLKAKKKQRAKGIGLLSEDASKLVGFSIEGGSDDDDDTTGDQESVKKARAEVDRLRGEMQRAAEGIRTQSLQKEQIDSSVVKKKKKKVKSAEGEANEGESVKKKKKKKKDGEMDGSGEKQKKAKKNKESTAVVSGDTNAAGETT